MDSLKKLKRKQGSWILFQILFCYSSADYLWKGPILVPKVLMEIGPKIAHVPMTQFVNSTEPKMICGCSCDRLAWCTTWCFDKVNGTCYKSNAELSPLYVTTSNDNYHCYTHQEPDFIVGANVTSSPGSGGAYRFPSNLVQGIYNFNDGMTCGLAYSSNSTPWMLFDLITPQIIHEIRITTQYYVWNNDIPYGAEVRVSVSSPVIPGNFSNFGLLGTFADPTQPRTTVSFKMGKGTKVQYISIQKFNGSNMAVCGVKAI